jgi:hypothetical protein
MNAMGDGKKSIIAEVMSKEDEVRLRNELRKFAGAFGIESEVKKEEPAPIQEEKRTIADVADKALEMTEGLVASLSSTLQKIAPDVWRIMTKQQYVKAISGVVTPWGIFIFIFVYLVVVNKKWKVPEKNNSKKGEELTDEEAETIARTILVYIIPVIVLIGSGIWGIVGMSNALKFVINPEFYAIKDLLLVLLGQPSAG